MIPTPTPRQLTITAALLFLIGCKSTPEEEWQGPPKLPQDRKGAPKASSADRLPPGQLMEGSEVVYGFSIPKGMTYVRPTPRSVRIDGRVDFDALAEYVKDRIAVRHAEMIDGRLVFPNAKIRGNEKDIFDLTITARRGRTNLLIERRVSFPGTHGLSEKQRWEKAGLQLKDGRIDPSQLE